MRIQDNAEQKISKSQFYWFLQLFIYPSRRKDKSCIQKLAFYLKLKILEDVALLFKLHLSFKISFRSYSLMVNSITRSLNIVAILSKNKDRKTLLSIKLCIRFTHARSHFQSKYSERKCSSIH